MGKYRRLTHSVYKCDYHIVWTPKYRYRVLEGQIASLLERDIHLLSMMKDVEIEALNVQKDHVHLLCCIPPKLSISSYLGFVKGETAIKLFQSYPKLKKSPIGGIIFGHEVTL